MAAGGGAAHAHEQPRSRRGRAPRRAGGVWRDGQGGAQLGRVRRDRRVRCARSRTTRRCSCRAASRWPCSARTRGAPRVLIANCEPRRPLGDVGAFPRARAARAHDVRPDDRRLVDLHRLAGHRAGHVRDLRRRGAHALRRLARRAPRASRPDSAAWAARSRSPPRCRAPRCSRFDVDESRIDKRLATGYCDAKARTLDEGLAMAEAGAARRARLLGGRRR